MRAPLASLASLASQPIQNFDQHRSIRGTQYPRFSSLHADIPSQPGPPIIEISKVFIPLVSET
jgi:hypothetical protein